MTHSPMAPLLAEREERVRAGGTFGLRTGEIVAIPEDGRYVVKWDSGNVRSDSAPARMATFMAGPSRGAYFPLELGDEVVCGFREGAVDEPIIIGALHSDQDPPPPDADTTESNNTRTILSREGSELTFDDTPGETAVKLKSAGGIEITLVDGGENDPGVLTLKLSETAKIEVSKDSMVLQFNNENKIEMGADGVTVVGSVINLNP